MVVAMYLPIFEWKSLFDGDGLYINIDRFCRHGILLKNTATTVFNRGIKNVQTICVHLSCIKALSQRRND